MSKFITLCAAQGHAFRYQRSQLGAVQTISATFDAHMLDELTEQQGAKHVRISLLLQIYANNTPTRVVESIFLGLLFPMMVLNFAIAVGIVRYRRRQIDHVRRLRARQLEEFEAYKKEVAGELHDHFGQVKMQFAKLLRARGEEVDPGLASAIVDL